MLLCCVVWLHKLCLDLIINVPISSPVPGPRCADCVCIHIWEELMVFDNHTCSLYCSLYFCFQPSPGGAAAPPSVPPSAATLPASQQNSNFIMETLDRVKEEFAVLQAQNQK